VHIEYQLDSGEENSFIIQSGILEPGEYDLYMLSSDRCFGNPTSPYKTPTHVATMEIFPPCTCHLDSDCGQSGYTCHNKRRYYVKYYCNCVCKEEEISSDPVECCTDDDCAVGRCANYKCTTGPSVGFEVNLTRVLQWTKDFFRIR
jgi:hypothetical protein